MTGLACGRTIATACAALFLGACSASAAPTGTERGSRPQLSRESQQWLLDHREAATEFGSAVADIVQSVESNDMELFGDGPQRCADTAATLASTTDRLPESEREAFTAVADACAVIAGPAFMHDSAGVMAGLDPLFTALGTLTPILDAVDALS